MNYRGEIEKLYDILNSIEEPRIQSDITLKTNLSNSQLRDYLQKLELLGFVKCERKKLNQYNRMRFFWKITEPGRIWKDRLEVWVMA